jgi:hypothetical protein
MERLVEHLLSFLHSSHSPNTIVTTPLVLVTNGNPAWIRRVTVTLMSLALVCTSLSTGTLWAATITAASCSRNDVETAVNSAANGDTVLIPRGTCTWTTNLTIANKYLSLQGAGTEFTIIRDGVSKDVYPNIPQVLVWDTIDGGLSRLAGITFQGGTITDGYNKGIVQIGGASRQFRVDHCKFIPTQTSALFIYGNLWGVIDHNVFDLSAGHGFAVYVMGGTYGDTAWAEGSTLGTERNVFLEDNIFTQDQSLGFHYYGVDGWNGSRVVYRHNQFNALTLGNHGTESGGRQRSQRQFEIYNNTWTWKMMGNSFPSLIGIRGGTGVIYNNSATISNGTINHFIDYQYYRALKSFFPFGQCPSVWDLSGNRCLDQTGVGQGTLISGDSPTPAAWPNQIADPTYDWNNLINGVVSNAFSNVPSVVQENRDFFHQIKPAYTPYIYPHPLTSGATATIPSPIPLPLSPQNLKVH